MKKLVLFSLISFSLCADQSVIVDPHFSPYMGGDDLFFAEWALTKASEYFQPPSRRDLTSIVWRRTLEQIGWFCLNSVTSIVQHEFFGHGYRLRELGITPNGYQISVASGATYFEIDENTFPIGKMLAVDVAGLEAEAILAQILKMNWMVSNGIDGRIGMTYFQAETSLFWYTLITHLGHLRDGIPDTPGNDIESYRTFLNASYPNSSITFNNLMTWAAFNWLDPMTFYTLASWFYYIAHGTPFCFPTFCFGHDLTYLPNIRIGYAPYGPEAYFENYFSYYDQALYAYIKAGPRSFGIGGIYDALFCGDWGKVGIYVDTWVQNKFISDATIADFVEHRPTQRNSLLNKQWGIAASLTGQVTLFNSCFRLFAQLGGKTVGYLPGYQLGHGVIARIGITIGE